MRLRAMAKINLGLDILGKREDGYHEVRMLMQTIQMYDLLDIRKKSSPGITLTTNLLYVPSDERNLVYKAAKLLMDEFQVEQGIQAVAEKYSELGFIRISKSIVVNIYRVRKIKADVNMKMQLVLDNGEKVILNRSYKNDFLQFIRERRNEHATH